jgi:hypothetical protein
MHLNTVQEIERAIDALTPQQIEELYVWLDQRHPQPIDAQLKADLDAGRIDDRINRALPANIRARADKQFALLKNRNILPCNSRNLATARGRKSGRRG